MNFVPMTTRAELDPFIKKIENIRGMQPGSILSGYGYCIGNEYNNFKCGRKISDISFGWHICTHRAEN
jgi:hypothetical protein